MLSSLKLVECAATGSIVPELNHWSPGLEPQKNIFGVRVLILIIDDGVFPIHPFLRFFWLEMQASLSVL